MNSKVFSSDDGNVIVGSIVGPNEFVASVRSGMLFNITVDPKLTEDSAERASSAELQSAYEMRQEVQRVFEGEKEKNVPTYADYIIKVQLENETGAIPSIILWTPNSLETEALDLAPLGRILAPYGEKLIAIDGETQLAARWSARQKRPEIERSPVTIKIYHGIPVGWARQAFFDLNVLGVQPNAAVAIAMDLRDPLTKIARSVELAVPFFTGRVNKDRRQLRKADDAVMTITALRSGIVTLAEGITGVKHGTGPVTSIHSNRLPGIEKIALEWYGDVAKTLGAHIEDRSNKVAGAPPVIAALGALGHELLAYADDVAGRRVKAEEILGRLASVNWLKGRAWDGILGKFTAKGKFSIGGTKETVYSVFRALSDPASPEGRQVRGVDAKAAVVQPMLQ